MPADEPPLRKPPRAEMTTGEKIDMLQRATAATVASIFMSDDDEEGDTEALEWMMRAPTPAAPTRKDTAELEGGAVVAAKDAAKDTDADPKALVPFVFPRYDATLAARSRPSGLDRQALAAAPQRGPSHPLFFWRDERVTVIYDGYPKASVHLLVLENTSTIQNVHTWAPHASATGTDLLAHMDRVSAAIVDHLRETTHPRWRFNRTFHVKPSMTPLHLHIYSLDLEASPNMKTKHHYTCFASPAHYVTLEQVVAAAAQRSAPLRSTSASPDLACMWCGIEQPNMPKLKLHLASCHRRRTCDV